jgi:hypothetical protein
MPMDDRLPDDPAIDYLMLGHFQADYHTGTGWHYFLLVSTSLVAALLIGVAAVFATLYFSESGPAGVGIAGMIGFGLLATFPLACLFLLLDKLNWRVLLFANGLVLDRNKRFEMIPWDHVNYLFAKRVLRHGAETDQWLRIELMSGKKITLDVSFRDLDSLAKRVREGSQPSLLSRALAQLGLNKSLELGPLKLTPDGLANSKEKIKWDQVESISFDLGAGSNLVIRKKGEPRCWSSWAGKEFPNVELFLLLANRFRQAHP